MKHRDILLSILILVIVLSPTIYFNCRTENNFLIDSILLKTSIKSGGFFSEHIKITNVANTKKQFNIDIVGLEDFVNVKPSKFNLSSGETKQLEIAFSNKNEMPEGVYTGELKISCDSEVKYLPVLLEIESEDVLFDSNIVLFPMTKISPGDNIKGEIKIHDLSFIGVASVDLSYFIKNFKGERVISESETIVAEGSEVLISKPVNLPENIEEGDYVFAVVLKYKDSIGTSSVVFKVEKEKIFDTLFDKNFTFLVIFLFFIFLIFLLFVYHSIFSVNKLMRELRYQYKNELKQREDYLKRRQKENEKYLKTRIERKLNRKLFKEIRKSERKAIKEVHMKRVRKIKKIRKRWKKSRIERQIQLWKKKGYDVSLLEPSKIPTAASIKKQIRLWKKKGYNTSVLEK